MINNIIEAEGIGIILASPYHAPIVLDHGVPIKYFKWIFDDDQGPRLQIKNGVYFYG